MRATTVQLLSTGGLIGMVGVRCARGRGVLGVGAGPARRREGRVEVLADRPSVQFEPDDALALACRAGELAASGWGVTWAVLAAALPPFIDGTQRLALAGADIPLRVSRRRETVICFAALAAALERLLAMRSRRWLG